MCHACVYIYIYMVRRSFLSYAPPNAGHSGFRMYAVLIQQLVNLHSCLCASGGDRERDKTYQVSIGASAQQREEWLRRQRAEC